MTHVSPRDIIKSQNNKLEVRETDSTFEKQANLQIIRSTDMFALKVYGDGFIPISDYKFQSSADGETELCVTFKGVPYELDLKACLTQ